MSSQINILEPWTDADKFICQKTTPNILIAAKTKKQKNNYICDNDIQIESPWPIENEKKSLKEIKKTKKITKKEKLKKIHKQYKSVIYTRFITSTPKIL